jgi:N-methylhydantoinase B/oxoprolinase/acetone carboxylase alpha subunit
MRVTAEAEITANAVLDRTKPGFGAWGLAGGGLGGPAAIRVKRRGDTEFRTFADVFGTASPSKFTNVELQEGDEVLIDSPGGGGYGDPRERDRALVEADVRQGFVSEAVARAGYGWAGGGS